MAKDDLGDVTQIMRKIVKAIESKKSRIAVVALKDVEGRMKERIFNRGLDSGGRLIGKYSTKPMLVGSSSFLTKTAAKVVFSSKKKRRKLKWVTVKGNALAVLEGGYKEFRKISRRQNSKVDLELSSDLRNGIQVGTNGGDPVLGFINDLSATKAEGNEARFKKSIFSVSKSESIALDKAIDREINAIIKRVVRSV